MANNMQVKSGVQLWQHIVTEMEQEIVTDATTTSYTLKHPKMMQPPSLELETFL